MTKTEIEIIKAIIAQLKCEPRPYGQPREAESVRHALRETDAALYLDTWVIPALDRMLPGERHDPELALDLVQ